MKYLDYNPYANWNHSVIKDIIRDTIMSEESDEIVIGFFLEYVYINELFKNDGYTSISDYAFNEYKIEKTKCNRLRNIASKFCVPGLPVLKIQYKDFSISCLSEMLYLNDKQLDQVNSNTTVSQIRLLKLIDIDDYQLIENINGKKLLPTEIWFIKAYFRFRPNEFKWLMKLCQKHKKINKIIDEFCYHHELGRFSDFVLKDFYVLFDNQKSVIHINFMDEYLIIGYKKFVETVLNYYDPYIY